jgi:UDP-2,4-diacetamido-2,4,6-trideoxy-beta-L-altropyranose hydrolase
MHEIQNPFFVRVDASESIGYGHVTRCLAFSKMLKNKFLITFCCINLPKDFANKIIQDEMHVSLIKTEHEFISMLSIETYVLIDGYQFNSGHHREISRHAKKLIAIDERNEMHHHADILINNTPSLQHGDFSIRQGGKIFSGVEYSILRQEFREQSAKPLQQKNTHASTKAIFIAFGGTDPLNFSQQTLDILFDINDEHFNITLMLGAGFSHSLNTASLKTGSSIQVVKNLEPIEIIKHISASDCVIVPASTILLEVFCVGAPVISGWYADNQKYSVKYFETKDMIFNCGNLNRNFSHKLKRAIKFIDEMPVNFHATNQKSIDLSGKKLLEIIDEQAL